MSNQNQEAFEVAMAEVFEGREVQFGDASRKLLRQFYDHARAGGGSGSGSRSTTSGSKIGKQVARFKDLQPGDVFQNSYLRGQDQARRVVSRVSNDEIIVDLVNVVSGHSRQEAYTLDTFNSYNDYEYITL